MNLFDQAVLLATGLVALYAIWLLIGQQKDEATKHIANYYYMVSFAVLFVSGVLLIFLGWEILGLLGHGSGTSKFVAIVATLIPFSFASGLVARFYPEKEKMYLGIMVLGIVLIGISRVMDMGTFAKIIYPVFHSIAGLTIFLVPIMMVKNDVMGKGFYGVTVGGTLIGLGGIALAFLTAGKQLLFFSPEFVLMILAPLLFLTAFSYMWGLKNGEK
ncbi:MAG: hypothetical protein HOD43_02005 [Candidatus Marinimicrobia bacterium]|jgi:hypothetical protein|nr:hypothetical protein [Candidatus Neomarinimicrobiota bacterium]MBT3824680.1 hypothetical protein [Candidatus Neomarinimicrobiota bacterium]MBT4130407.1 hypothetical protein [Candidatus Neomarinimicrobiota bacterium]MBT4294562.1 hypothetical protein [Candidatus Neomarinimicrobiota bacterium]MBT4419374.1 hypothetical protein [Candidatus Neomarinimicrobiota bacterium]